MATCENCSTNFTPSAKSAEVSSARILCEKCEAERRAERLKRAAASSAASSVAARPQSAKPAPASTTARAGAPSVPAAKRAAPAAPPASPIVRRTASAKPADATDSAASKPVAARASATPKPAPRAAAPVPAGAPPGAAQAPRATAHTGEHHEASEHRHFTKAANLPKAPGHPDVKREIAMLKKREDKIMTYVWMACGVLLLVASGILLKVKFKKDAEAAEIKRQVDAVAVFVQKMKSFDVNVESQASEAIKFAKENEAIWRDQNGTSEVGPILSRAQSTIESAKERREMEGRLSATLDGARDAANKKVADLVLLRRGIDDLMLKAEGLGPEFNAKVIEAKTTVERAYVTRLHDDAKAAAAKGPSEARAALNTYTKAEDEVRKLFDLALQQKNKEAQDFLKPHYVDIMSESDALATALFTPDVIEKTPWKDLLAPDEIKHWQNDGLKGFRIENGVLQATGADAGATKEGLIDVPDAGGWRDFQLDMEFTLKGSTALLYRLGRRVDQTVEKYAVATGKDSFKAGQPYTVLATFVGSKIDITFTPPDAPAWGDTANPTMSRKGAFGMTIPAGAEVKITRLRIRELR